MLWMAEVMEPFQMTEPVSTVTVEPLLYASSRETEPPAASSVQVVPEVAEVLM